MADRKQLTFDILSARDFLAKLHEEQAAVECDLVSSRHAINAAMTAHHLFEWVWGLSVKPCESLRTQLSVNTRDEFRSWCFSKCPQLETMQCVAEGSKHLGTTGKRVQSTSLRRGAFSSGFGKGFNISRLEISKFDGSAIAFDNELKTVVAFWDRFFSDYLEGALKSELATTQVAR